MTEMTFQERIAARRAKFEAEWAAAHAPMALTNDDILNPHKHYANMEAGSHCFPDVMQHCFVPHNCTCPVVWACNGGCYR